MTHTTKALVTTAIFLVLAAACWLTFQRTPEPKHEVAIESLHMAQEYDRAMSDRDLAEAKRCLVEVTGLSGDEADQRRSEVVRYAHLVLQRNSGNVTEARAILEKLIAAYPGSRAAKEARAALDITR